jgi:hypothetical protein
VAILQDLIENKRFRRGGDNAGADERFTVLVAPLGDGDGRSDRLLVFLDADAVVSDFDQTFEWSALSRGCRAGSGGGQPDAAGGNDLLALMCKEGDGGSVANTGVIVVRDHPDAAEMLSRWWSTGASYPATLYGMRHEQSALDRLLSHDEEVSARVGLAAPSAFNTAPPFYKTHQTSSFILHLMFEPYGGMRRRIFEQLLSVVRPDGSVDAEGKARIIADFPAIAEEAYSAAMGEAGADEDLAVMYAQLLWSVHGKARGQEALKLYAKAVELAPTDSGRSGGYAGGAAAGMRAARRRVCGRRGGGYAGGAAAGMRAARRRVYRRRGGAPPAACSP